MNNKLERHRALLEQKKTRLNKLQSEVEALEQLVQEEENTEIVAAVRGQYVDWQALKQFLWGLRDEREAPVIHETQLQPCEQAQPLDDKNNGKDEKEADPLEGNP